MIVHLLCAESAGFEPGIPGRYQQAYHSQSMRIQMYEYLCSTIPMIPWEIHSKEKDLKHWQRSLLIKKCSFKIYIVW